MIVRKNIKMILEKRKSTHWRLDWFESMVQFRKIVSKLQGVPKNFYVQMSLGPLISTIEFSGPALSGYFWSEMYVWTCSFVTDSFKEKLYFYVEILRNFLWKFYRILCRNFTEFSVELRLGTPTKTHWKRRKNSTETPQSLWRFCVDYLKILCGTFTPPEIHMKFSTEFFSGIPHNTFVKSFTHRSWVFSKLSPYTAVLMSTWFNPLLPRTSLYLNLCLFFCSNSQILQ